MVYYISGKYHTGEIWEDKARNKYELGRSFYAAHNNGLVDRNTIKVSTKYRTLTKDEVWELLDK